VNKFRWFSFGKIRSTEKMWRSNLCLMQFSDPQLKQHYDKTIACFTGSQPEQISILALLDAWNWFQLIEGEQSPRVTEALELLLSPELRPDLRAWFKHHGNNMNDSALQFRDRLSALAGEKFG